MTSVYRLSKSAESDLFEIWDYTVEIWGEVQAEKYLKNLENRFLELAMNPAKGRKRRDLSDDLFSFHEERHLIFYRLDDNGIAIARVLHERMDSVHRLENDVGDL